MLGDMLRSTGSRESESKMRPDRKSSKRVCHHHEEVDQNVELSDCQIRK